jgi:hypothetical protein
MSLASNAKVVPQYAKGEEISSSTSTPATYQECPRKPSNLLSVRLPVTWEEDADEIRDFLRSSDMIGPPDSSTRRRQITDITGLERFIMHGTSVQTNPKDPSTWPVHGGIGDMISKAIAERKTVESQQRFCVVLPDGKFRMAWDIMMMHCLIFVAVFTPFQMSFLQDEHDLTTPQKWIFFFTLDRLVDFFFFIDIVINFRSGWYEDDGSIISFNQDIAAREYLQ